MGTIVVDMVHEWWGTVVVDRAVVHEWVVDVHVKRVKGQLALCGYINNTTLCT